MLNPVKISDYWGSGMISACRYIRQCAQCDNIIIETESHKSNNRSNLLLMSIVNCGLNVKQFIRQYLSNIHPYELMVFGGSNSNIQADKTKLWVRDICYNSYIVIKLHNISTRSPIVISFHESNPNEKSRGRVDIDFDSKPCLVVIDKLSHSYDSFYSVEFTISRGLMEYKVVDETEYYNDTMALVSYSSINKAISNTMKSRFRNIMQTYSDVSTKELMNMTTTFADMLMDYRSFGFMTYGGDVQSDLVFLIELSSGKLGNGKIFGKRGRAALLDIAGNIISEQTNSKRRCLHKFISERYDGLRTDFISGVLELLK